MLAVFIIDCGEHTILERLAREGRMPTFARLTREGASVRLTSEAHILDGSVFQTLLTGVNPGRHGIYKYRQLVPGTYRFETTKAKNSPADQIWSCLSRQGRRCAVFDVPKAWPVQGFRGTLLASWGAYSPAADPASIPDDLLPHILAKYGRHPQRNQLPVPIPPEKYQQVLNRLIRGAQCRSGIIQDLMAMGSYDFLITAFSETHVASHQFWHLRDPNHPLFDKAAADLCGDAMESLYEAVDAEVAKMIDALPLDSHIVLMTQQGVQNNYSGSYLIPEWLARRTGRRHGIADRWRVRATTFLGTAIRDRLGRTLPSRLTDLWTSAKYRPEGDVYMLPGSEFMAFLQVNLRGREPEGTVPPDQYQATLDQLRQDILALKNPDTGKPAAAEVIFPRDRFLGERQNALPDIIIRWKNDAPIRALDCPVQGRICRGLQFTDVNHSSHTGEGLAVIAGPGITLGAVEEAHPLQDLTATFYALLNAAQPQHLEGKPIPLADR